MNKAGSARKAHANFADVLHAAGLPPSPLDACLEAGDEILPPLIENEIDWLLELLNTSKTGWGQRGTMDELWDVLVLRLRQQLTFTGGFIGQEVIRYQNHEFRPYGHTGSETTGHRYAKYMAEAWIASMGGKPVTEKRIYGGRVDVWCAKPKISVECGSLCGTRLKRMVYDEDRPRVIIVPLCAATDAHQKGDTFLPLPYIEATLSGEWEATRDELEHDRREALREKFSRVRNPFSTPYEVLDGEG